MTKEHIDKIKEYMKKEFNRSVHKKYRKYFDEWFSNLTETQLLYFYCWMNGKLTPYTA